MSEHTPTPWTLGEGETAVEAPTFRNGHRRMVPVALVHDPNDHAHATQVAKENARFITLAVNSHDKLRRDRDALLEALKWAMIHVGRYSHRIKGQNDAYCDAYDEAVAAIQQAESKD